MLRRLLSLGALLILTAPSPGRTQVLPVSDAAFSASLGQAAEQARRAPARTQPPPSRYRLMRSSLEAGSRQGGDLEVEVESAVDVLQDIPVTLRAKIQEFYQRTGEQPPAVAEIYLYRYRIINHSDADIQVSFSAREFIGGPFIEILQGFHVDVPAGRAYSVSYVSTRAPQFMISPMHVGLQDPATGRFSYSGSAASLYYPDRVAPYEAVDNGLVPEERD